MHPKVYVKQIGIDRFEIIEIVGLDVETAEQARGLVINGEQLTVLMSHANSVTGFDDIAS